MSVADKPRRCEVGSVAPTLPPQQCPRSATHRGDQPGTETVYACAEHVAEYAPVLGYAWTPLGGAS